jgi:hypothetical protein
VSEDVIRARTPRLSRPLMPVPGDGLNALRAEPAEIHEPGDRRVTG